MKHLLDVNVLLAAVWTGHSHNARTQSWLKGKEVVLCPISELGFLRISTHRKAYALPMDRVRAGLEKFATERKALWIPDDLNVLESKALTSEEVTDRYLADLAAKHGFKLATFDEGLAHASAELIT